MSILAEASWFVLGFVAGAVVGGHVGVTLVCHVLRRAEDRGQR